MSMKKINYIMILFTSLLIMEGCEIDNYLQPDSILYGKAIDSETGEVILQDVGAEGTQIEFVQQGFSTVASQFFNFKTDGSYRENNLFTGTYVIKVTRTNFVPVEDFILNVDGKTELNFVSVPYCRIAVEEFTFRQSERVVYARFTVTCTSDDALKEIAIFCDPNKNVSFSINNDGSRDCRIAVGRKLTQPETFEITMPVASLTNNSDYYFRIGALSSASQARYNYNQAVKMHITK